MIKIFLRTILGFLFAVLIFIVVTKTLPLSGTIPVLVYQSIGSPQEAKDFKHFVSRQSFAVQMAFLHYFGYRVLPIQEYEQILKGRRAPHAREVLITFDAGDLSFGREAWPVLQRYGFPVTIFLVSESVKRETNNSMSRETLEALLKSPLLTIGSNSKTHAALSQLNEIQKKEETAGSKEDLEDFFKGPVNYFAYPNGDVDAESLAAVKSAGYQLAFTTSHHKLSGLKEDPFSLTRLNITRSSDDPIVFWIKITGLYQMHKHYWYRLKNWLGQIHPS